MKYLITGLGNIGAEYTSTRHNIGFSVLDHLAKQHNAVFQLDRLAHIAFFRHRGKSLYLIQPTTYMNSSGRSVRYWLQKLQIPISNSLVILDDTALPLGKLRLRPQGADAGHNGLRSIASSIATQTYPRLRIGIGNGFSAGQQARYVLEKFTAQEEELLPAIVQRTCDAVLVFCKEGIQPAMNKYNSTAPPRLPLPED